MASVDRTPLLEVRVSKEREFVPFYNDNVALAHEQARTKGTDRKKQAFDSFMYRAQTILWACTASDLDVARLSRK